jgi:aminomethyltransferase
MEEAFGKDVSRLSYMHFTEINSSGRKALISRSGYTGEDGFEIYASSSHASFFWDLILEKGRNYGLNLCGLGARDILRIEAGYPLYGHEIDGKTNPLEASLGWVVKLNKDFIGKEELLKIKKEGIRRRRVGFLMQERAPARQGYQIYAQGKSIGSVCSGTYSPNLDKFIGMAYVDIDFAKAETAVEIKIRDKLYRAKITNFTFIEARTKNELIRR